MPVSFDRSASLILAVAFAATGPFSQVIAEPASLGPDVLAHGAIPPPDVGSPRPRPGAVILTGAVVHLRLDQTVSSTSAAVGDLVRFTTDEPISLSGGAAIAAGYHGLGEVTQVRAATAGQTAQLAVRPDYLLIGATRARLRANSGPAPDSWVARPASPDAGAAAIYVQGERFTAYIDQSVALSLPIAPPGGD